MDKEAPTNKRQRLDYNSWTKDELKEECRRLRLKVGGSEEELIARLKEETRSQPRLMFKPREDVGEAEPPCIRTQGEDEVNEGGEEDRDPKSEPNDGEDPQWEDITPGRGESYKKGATCIARLCSPGKTASMCTGRTKRGYWLGRKAKLCNGEAPRRIKKKGRDNTNSGERLNTEGNRVKSRGSRAKLGPGEESELGQELNTTHPSSPTPD